mmetsp:Transcript_14635/g.42104  ORF Transcript_14635/g.42104 Transcript_14635/m.42104 type:complete len:1172 (-) Transcript_14635:329-3844(-)
MDLPSAATTIDDPLRGFSIDDDDDLVDEDVTVLDPLRTVDTAEGADEGAAAANGSSGGSGAAAAARIATALATLNSSLSEERMAAAAAAAAPPAVDAPTPVSAPTASTSTVTTGIPTTGIRSTCSSGAAAATTSLLRSNQESIVAEALSHLGGETSPAANGQQQLHLHHRQQQQQQQHPLAPSTMNPSSQHGGIGSIGGGGSSATSSLAARIGGAAGSIGGSGGGVGSGPSWYENVASQAGSLARKTATTLQDAAVTAGTAVAHAAAQAEGAVSHLDQQVALKGGAEPTAMASQQPYMQQQSQAAAHSFQQQPREPIAPGGGQATTMVPPSAATPSSTPSSSIHGQPSQPEMDNAMKSALLSSALEGGGDSLLPGERVIMFISHLSNVRDSAGTNTGIGTDYDLMVCDRASSSLASMFPPSATENGQSQQSAAANAAGGSPPPSKNVIWCCAMTFYRVILFTYRECDFPCTIPDGNATDAGNDSSTSNKSPDMPTGAAAGDAVAGEPCGETNSDDCHVDQASKVVLDEVVQTASVSRQYQLAQDWARRRQRRHHVLQMPLASIERVERISQYTGGALSTAQVPYATTGSSLGLTLFGKDNSRYLRFTAPNYNDVVRANEALNTYAFPGRRNLGYLFAFESRRTEVMASIQKVDKANVGAAAAAATGTAPQQPTQQIITARCTPRRYEARKEFDRLRILVPRETTGSPSPWKTIHSLNSTYTLCPSYPSVLVGPRQISDDSAEGQRILRRVAAFRSEGRMPVLTWGNAVDGASIWRSSQPRVGLQGNRSSADEHYLRTIAECAANAAVPVDKTRRLLKIPGRQFLQTLIGGTNEDDLLMHSAHSGRPPVGLKIMDLRPKSSAVANRTQGYGYENTSYYTGCDISFHGIGNIHAVRDSYQKISSLCQSPSTNDVQWAQLVEDTKWLSHVRLILSASWQTAFHVRYNRLPVLLHCSHGWDRTSQVAALAELLLDGHYRTKVGFSTLIEKDFMAFGHPFHTRCGHGEGKGERGGVAAGQVGGGGDEGQLSPIFMQFLDCCFQLVNQYPEYFEFNAEYLLVLSEHVYSCRFGTLLCDTERERELVAGIRQRTHCLWEYLDSRDDLTNPGYYKKADVLMMPLPTLLRNVTLWVDRHCMYGPKPTVRCLAPSIDELCRSVAAGAGAGAGPSSVGTTPT